MATLGDMIGRIAGEIDRTDLTATQIPQAIQTAVHFYERQGFFFNEGNFVFNTVLGQEYYGAADNALIPISPNIQLLRLEYGGSTRWDLVRQTFDYIDSISASSAWRGVPECWAYREQKIRIYPIPSQVWPITVFNTLRDSFDINDPSYAGVWVNDAEYLIRTRAKIELYNNVIIVPDAAVNLPALMMQEVRAIAALRGETASREAMGQATPTDF